MKPFLIASLLLLFSANVLARDSSKPRISPFFDRIDDGPAFFVECRNTTGQTVTSAAYIWASGLRIDGKLVPEEAHEGPGLTTDVPPGKFWRGIIALRQSYRPFFPAPQFDALVRSARTLSLSEGKHTIAVQCGGSWSDEFSFYWETETHP